MKKFFHWIFRIVMLIAVIGLGVLLALKLNKDALETKAQVEKEEQITSESETMVVDATTLLQDIKHNIEKDTGVTVEMADTGSMGQIDIYFVTKVGEEYKYIVKNKTEDGTEKFDVAQTPEQGGTYIVSLDALGLKNCVYTDVNNYILDKDGNIQYVNN